eukprot:1717419-Rhodomonas_salina.1
MSRYDASSTSSSAVWPRANATNVTSFATPAHNASPLTSLEASDQTHTVPHSLLSCLPIPTQTPRSRREDKNKGHERRREKNRDEKGGSTGAHLHFLLVVVLAVEGSLVGDGPEVDFLLVLALLLDQVAQRRLSRQHHVQTHACHRPTNISQTPRKHLQPPPNTPPESMGAG